MKHRIRFVALGLVLGAAACSSAAPTEPAHSTVAAPRTAEREDLPNPPRP
jgi:ABC-type glycerol-3-phosphate transport system substrate-binding protein